MLRKSLWTWQKESFTMTPNRNYNHDDDGFFFTIILLAVAGLMALIEYPLLALLLLSMALFFFATSCS